MTSPRGVDIPRELLSPLRDLIESACGTVLSDAKLPHLSAVVRGRMTALGIADPSDYMGFLSEGGGAETERRGLAFELLVGETRFFRNPALFHAFGEDILRGMIERGFAPPLSLWCAGCATGEEAYSIAIATLESFNGRQAVPVRIRATDLHPGFLEAARQGIYPGHWLLDLPERVRSRYFEPVGAGRYRVSDEVRRLVDFEEHNLVDFLSGPLPARKYAAIFCRNVMIYFRPDTTRRIVERFHGSLEHGGVLFLGHSETLWGISEAFLLEQREKVFYYRKPYRESPSPPAAAVPRNRRRNAPPRIPPRGEEPVPPAPVATAAMDLVLSAEREADAGRFEDAVRMCRDASVLDPALPEAEYLISFLLRGKGRHAEALYHADRALARDPNFVFANVEAAECLSGMGREEDAAIRWRMILRAIEGTVRFPRLSVGAGISPKTLRQYVLSRLPR